MGFITILFVLNENYGMAAVSYMIILLCDSIDGSVARKTNTTTEFGVELDSLSDFLNFIVIPCIICFLLGYDSSLSITAYCFFIVSGISRLAYFNISESIIENGKKVYLGMPTTMVGATLYIIVTTTFSLGGIIHLVIIPLSFFLLALLMMSSIKFVRAGIVTIAIIVALVCSNLYLLSISL